MERIHPEDRFSLQEILNRAVRDKSDFEYERTTCRHFFESAEERNFHPEDSKSREP